MAMARSWKLGKGICHTDDHAPFFLGVQGASPIEKLAEC